MEYTSYVYLTTDELIALDSTDPLVVELQDRLLGATKDLEELEILRWRVSELECSEERVAELERDISYMNDDIDDYESTINKLERENSKFEDEVERLQSMIEELKIRVSELSIKQEWT